MRRRIDVFFYGLFMDASLLRSKGAAPENVRLASVDGYAIRIGNRATLVRRAGSTSHGVVISMPIPDVDLLYSEASVSMYRPEAVLAQLDDGVAVPALCFNLVETPGPSERNAQYAEKLRALAEHLGLPANYVAQIQ
jgi:hypothetical protein